MARQGSVTRRRSRGRGRRTRSIRDGSRRRRPSRTPRAARAGGASGCDGVSTTIWMYMSPTLRGAEHRHALALEAELLAGLAALGDLDPRLAAVDLRHVELAAERRGGERDRHAAEDVGAVALEELVRPDRQEDVEVAGRAAAHARLALAAEADAGAVLDAGRDVDAELPLLGDAAGAAALEAGVGDHLAAALAGRAGALDREVARGGADAPVAVAGRADLGRRAALGAGARAGLADHLGRHLDLGGLADDRPPRG